MDSDLLAFLSVSVVKSALGMVVTPELIGLSSSTLIDGDGEEDIECFGIWNELGVVENVGIIENLVVMDGRDAIDGLEVIDWLSIIDILGVEDVLG